MTSYPLFSRAEAKDKCTDTVKARLRSSYVSGRHKNIFIFRFYMCHIRFVRMGKRFFKMETRSFHHHLLLEGDDGMNEFHFFKSCPQETQIQVRIHLPGQV